MVHMVTYDLCSPGQNYDDVIEAVKNASTGVWCRVCESSYLIKSDLKPEQVFNEIKPHLDENDKILVIEVKQEYYGRLKTDLWPYIKESIFS